MHFSTIFGTNGLILAGAVLLPASLKAVWKPKKEKCTGQRDFFDDCTPKQAAACASVYPKVGTTSFAQLTWSCCKNGRDADQKAFLAAKKKSKFYGEEESCNQLSAPDAIDKALREMCTKDGMEGIYCLYEHKGGPSTENKYCQFK
ncbi:hypothetical protein BGX33_000307 [Mortierella sp. NVP41]|nr:hypothetical protein BGX33_000307 [Mortierella sp. NVP41]